MAESPLHRALQLHSTSPLHRASETQSTSPLRSHSIEHRSDAEQKRREVGEREGIVYIFTSFNNTIVHATDLSGNTISRISGGIVTKQDRLKANPTVAMFVAKRVAEMLKDNGVNALYIRIRAKTGSSGLGPGAHAVVKSLSKEGFRIISIVDTTRIPRGGPKPAGGRRGRRV
ncbi:30S ribosomal protein S11 [Candidatus Pacearchaeota archaeon]|nr:30S ribosomal protein S11 [Candidatus Pacearchaeota archaeon]